MNNVYYLYHPESDCLWIETDKQEYEKCFTEGDGMTMELDYTRYLELLNEQDDIIRD